jgi:WD40 repeat protein
MMAPSENPFVGLRPFETEESLLFFGRQDQILELLQKLHEHQFVAIIGSSGSGKSSLIKAGLIPRLKAGYLVNQRDQWLVAIMKPGQTPLYNLALSLYTALGFTDQHQEIENLVTKIKDEGADALVDLLQHLWEKQNTSVFILVDQFEELFRFSSEKMNKDESIDFVNILLDLASRSELPIYASITMRSDFIGDCDQFYGLPEALNRSQYLVPRLNRVQLKSAIEAPIKLYGGKINPALTSKLLNEVQSTKDELPLLQHLLMRIWDYEEKTDRNGELDLKDFEEVGGIAKALSNHAEEALIGMTENELKASKKIFQALTAVDENGRKIRRPAKLSELIAITSLSKDKVLNIIQQFNDDKRCFIVLNPIHGEDDILVDISHESLIRQWERLGTWVDEETEAGNTYEQLSESALLYNQKKKDLLSGSELQINQQWLKEFAPTKNWASRYNRNYDEVLGYLTKSSEQSELQKKQIKKQKRNRLIAFTGGSLLIISLIGTIPILKLREKRLFAATHDKTVADSLYNVRYLDSISRRTDSISKQNEITQQQKAKFDSLRISLQEESNANMSKINTAYSFITAAQEWELTNPTIALRLAEEATNLSNDNTIFSITKRILITYPFYKTIVQSDDKKPSFISPDGELTVTGSSGGNIYLYDNIGRKINSLPGHYSSLRAAGFSEDKTSLALGTIDGDVILWNLNNGSKKSWHLNSKAITSVAISQLIKGKIFVRSEDYSMHIISTDNGDEIVKGDDIITLVVIPKKNEVVTGSRFGKVRIWNASTAELKSEIDPQITDGDVTGLDYSNEFDMLAVGYKDQVIRMFDSKGQLKTFFRVDDEVCRVQFVQDINSFQHEGSDSVQMLAVAMNNSSVSLYRVSFTRGESASSLYQLSGNNNITVSMGFIPRGFYTTTLDGACRTWSVYSKEPNSLAELQQFLNNIPVDKLPKKLPEK